MHVRLKLFAVAKQYAGCSELALELPPSPCVADLRTALLSAVPTLAPLAGHLRFSVNADYADDATLISPTSELACIPPVSGG